MTVKEQIDKLVDIYYQYEELNHHNDVENQSRRCEGKVRFSYVKPFWREIQITDSIDDAAESVGLKAVELPRARWINDDGEVELSSRSKGFKYRGVQFFQLIHEEDKA